MVFFVTGANGSGKSTCLAGLQNMFPEVRWYDFDDVFIPARTRSIWRQRATEHWLRVAHGHQTENIHTGICGHAIPGEILACPTAICLDGIAMLLLDCEDRERILRLRARGETNISQSTLNWAGWQRMHAFNPQWHPEVIISMSETWLLWDHWKAWQWNDPRWAVCRIENSRSGIDTTNEMLAAWVSDEFKLHAKRCNPFQGNWWSQS